MLSLYSMPKISHGSSSSTLKIESLASVTSKMKTSYHYVKGKSFDNRMVFAPQCTFYCEKIVRSVSPSKCDQIWRYFATLAKL